MKHNPFHTELVQMKYTYKYDTDLRWKFVCVISSRPWLGFLVMGGGGEGGGGNRSSTYLPSCKDKLTLVKFELSTPNT